jgi:glycosyltransferase involved in cell wall biosynthesis
VSSDKPCATYNPGVTPVSNSDPGSLRPRTPPRITIVTPSFNQARYLEETICSVLEQGYPNLEYIVMDGGSTDGSVEIIEKYAEHIDYWVSEPDGGQAAALASGFARATGDVYGWLCSDDVYKPGALALAGAMFELVGDLTLVYGDTEYLYPDGTRQWKPRISYHPPTMRYFNVVSQPSAFFSASAYRQCGGIDTSLGYAMDYDLFLRIGTSARCVNVPVVMSTYRMHDVSKTISERERFIEENWAIREKVFGRGYGKVEALRLRYHFGRAFVRYRVERGVWKFGEDRRLRRERQSAERR